MIVIIGGSLLERLLKDLSRGIGMLRNAFFAGKNAKFALDMNALNVKSVLMMEDFLLFLVGIFENLGDKIIPTFFQSLNGSKIEREVTLS